jgi:transposase InsO family protein
MAMAETTLEDRLVSAFASRKHLPEQARRALLQATELLTFASLLALNRLSSHFDPGARLLARLRRTQFLLAQAEDRNRILLSRIERIAPRHRPHYSPEIRFQILCHRQRYLLSVSETGRRFGVSTQTILRWLDEARRSPDCETVGSLLKPVPPLRRIRDVVRQLVRDLKRHGFGGDRMVAQVLTNSAWSVSARSVGRFRKEPAPTPHKPPRLPRASKPIHARAPNEGWVLDLTEIPTLFRFFSLKLCVVLDLFSRFPVAARVSLKEPSADQIADLVVSAAGRHGKPGFLLSDQGSQFTARPFRRNLESIGIAQRFGAIGRSGSIAIVERFWKTLKNTPSLRWLFPGEVERRLELTLLHYAYHRPHLALGGRVPAEVYLCLPHHRPTPAPRGRPGEAGPEPPVTIAFLDPESETLPILVPRVA